MSNLNAVIANNILALLKQQNKRQIDLATALSEPRQKISRLLNGSATISAPTLKKIADYLHVSMDELSSAPTDSVNSNSIHAFMGMVSSDNARQALQTADELANMIVCHKKIRDHGNELMHTWEIRL